MLKLDFILYLLMQNTYIYLYVLSLCLKPYS